jgi:hypothetical protein
MFLRYLCLSCLLVLLLSLSFRILCWVERIRAIRKSIPVVPVLFPSTSKYRLLLPKSWQVYHLDWPMQHGRKIYHQQGSDIFALVSLFEHDKIFVSNPESLLEIKVTGSDRFQKDILAVQTVLPFCFNQINPRSLFLDPT